MQKPGQRKAVGDRVGTSREGREFKRDQRIPVSS